MVGGILGTTGEEKFILVIELISEHLIPEQLLMKTW